MAKEEEKLALRIAIQKKLSLTSLKKNNNENGLHLIILLDTYSIGVAVLLIGFLECIVVVYIYEPSGSNIASSFIRGVCCLVGEKKETSLPEKRKKLHSPFYNSSLKPVLMVRVAMDPDEISPTGIMIGAKPDSVIPHGFFLNPNKKDKMKNSSKSWSVVPHSHLTHPEELSANYWSTEVNKFSSIVSSRASSHQSASRESLSNFNQATQTEDRESDSSEKVSFEVCCQPTCDSVNISVDLESNQKHDKIINKSNKNVHKNGVISSSRSKNSLARQSKSSDGDKATFFLESSEICELSDTEEDNSETSGKRKKTRCNCHSCKCEERVTQKNEKALFHLGIL
ncbi:hypothetical protein GQR58_012898 [Nymphon striatum]|nr:hypothetical protein GQR58_012898 [Nymphon striatum]